MRIRQALNSYTRPCGCLVGVYETYAGEVIEILDAPGEGCADASHREGTILAKAQMPMVRPDRARRPET
jgi:hypothetical protein